MLPAALLPVAGFVISLCVSVALVFFSRRLHILNGRPGDLIAVQAAHVRNTPRVGGIAIMAALVVMPLLSPEYDSANHWWFILALAPLCAVSLLEDLGYRIQPAFRLLAAFVSSLFVITLLQVWLPRTGITPLDPAIVPAVGVPLTLLVTMGCVNAFNMIDGVNGLCATTAIMIALFLALVAEKAGLDGIWLSSLMLAAATAGFFLVNFPLGLIFLGDTGAYLLGFCLAWIGVFIVVLAPEVSPLAILLIFFWPLTDLLLAIVRRQRRRWQAMAPDRQHIHQLVMHWLECAWLGQGRRKLSNPLTTLLILPLQFPPMIAGYLLWNSNFGAGLTLLLLSILYWGGYFRLAAILQRRPPVTLRSTDVDPGINV